MIALSIILLIISFLIQGTMSTIIGYTPENVSMFFTIYPLLALLVLYPNFENQKKNYTFISDFWIVDRFNIF